ncbi:MAG: DUF4271 domain-containing protein [Bacteroidales bacterium]|nr:DUF4271 domain-containing protein [Bacteroidales bacterium]
MLQDSTNINYAVKDTVFIPTYLDKNPLYTPADSSENITCKQYIVTILQDSFPLPKKTETLFLNRETTTHNNLKLEDRQIETNNDWVLLTFITIIFILALEIRFAGKIIKDMLSGCFYKTPLNISVKDGDRVNLLSTLPLLFVFLPIFSLLLFYTADYFGYKNMFPPLIKNDLFIFLSIYILSIAVLFIKIILIKFFGWVFKKIKISNYYVQLHINFNFLLGLILIIPVFCFVYVDNWYKEIFLFVSFFFVVLEWVTRLIRTFSIIITSFRFSHIYLFFYLCTIELLPIIVLCKLLLF